MQKVELLATFSPHFLPAGDSVRHRFIVRVVYFYVRSRVSLCVRVHTIVWHRYIGYIVLLNKQYITDDSFYAETLSVKDSIFR